MLKSSLVNVNWGVSVPNCMSCLMIGKERPGFGNCMFESKDLHSHLQSTGNTASLFPLGNSEPETELHFIAKC